ncbi:hypothetical protein F1559_003167 [Cyanidiococcus yangmingshanensis]|uniref:valine--tRNA ligase n=1 Tax=Cyanidiococcus yangmingshanensis TaxID=2690220 RepID=A0A7J7IR78_9RHOD|nr:hypothetical protein F1559_003167 [Cyanidiococcus yangmingshanensis]
MKVLMFVPSAAYLQKPWLQSQLCRQLLNKSTQQKSSLQSCKYLSCTFVGYASLRMCGNADFGTLRTKAPLKLEQRPSFVRDEHGSMPKNFDPATAEESIYAWWEASGFFSPKERKIDKAVRPFVIVMPPPNVTGGLHMGHAIGTTIEDILIRFHRMKGRPALWLPGTDHAGIATQLLVERALNAEGKSRTEIGRDAFLEHVWQWKNEKGGYITKQLRKLGASADWKREKFTLSPEHSQAVTEAFVRLHDAGLIYRGSYMVNWSPALQTAVSDLEVEFSEEPGKLFFFKYPLAEQSGETAAFLPVATTRPETILGDTALCVHPNDTRYQKYIGMHALVPFVGRRIPIIADDHVDPEFGTGVLKITPGHDRNDHEIGRMHELPIVTVIGKDGRIIPYSGEDARYVGLDRFECRERLWADLQRDGLAIRTESRTMRVPRSQRGGEIIEPLVSTQWFVRVKPLAEKALEAVRQRRIRILPERFEKIYFHWLENIEDWCISRQLWWGHRIPVYYLNGDEGCYFVARDIEEARGKAFAAGKNDFILEQDPDVLDTWFSSGLWPFSTMGWPDESRADFQNYFPGTVLETGYDILFFWVARMIMLSLELTGEIPFETIYLHGLVRDANGRKMSKTLGNVIDPLEIIGKYGTDALRFTLVTGSAAGRDISLAEERIAASRNFANKVWNIARFVINAVGNGPSDEKLWLEPTNLGWSEHDLDLADRFILSQLSRLVQDVTGLLEEFEIGDAGQRIYDFLWEDFADWYVEIAKVVLRDTNGDLHAARQSKRILAVTLDICLRLLHPYMPFITEAAYQRLPHIVNREHMLSLMCQPWPEVEWCRDEASVTTFRRFQDVVRKIRNARSSYGVEPSRRIAAWVMVRAEHDLERYIESRPMVFAALAKLDEDLMKIIHTPPALEVVQKCVHVIVDDDTEVFLPMKGLFDVQVERERLGKQLRKLQADIMGLERRLSAKGFLQNAPPHIVEETQQKRKELQDTISSISDRLKMIDELA